MHSKKLCLPIGKCIFHLYQSTFPCNKNHSIIENQSCSKYKEKSFMGFLPHSNYTYITQLLHIKLGDTAMEGSRNSKSQRTKRVVFIYLIVPMCVCLCVNVSVTMKTKVKTNKQTKQTNNKNGHGFKIDQRGHT